MTPEGPPAIRLEELTKQYGRLVALRGVSLEVAPGEIFGFLGLNGAGKTTAIRILLDLVRASSGRAYVFGIDCHRDGVSARSRIGYLPGELGFYGDMTGEATLNVLARLNRHRVDARWQKELVERLDLSPQVLRKKVREYSTGMKRKLGIVQAFQSDATLLVLDEPTEGLDPLMQEAFYELLARTRRAGRTVFMSSHVLPEVERVCDRIGLVRQGELVLVSTVDEVRRLAARRVRVLFREPVAAPRDGWPEGCEALEVTPRLWHLKVRGPLGGVLAMLSSLPVEDIEVPEPHLEDVLRHYYSESAS
jgi:beta-exotoxin I transport system ATP-binding protein